MPIPWWLPKTRQPLRWESWAIVTPQLRPTFNAVRSGVYTYADDIQKKVRQWYLPRR